MNPERQAVILAMAVWLGLAAFTALVYYVSTGFTS